MIYLTQLYTKKIIFTQENINIIIVMDTLKKEIAILRQCSDFKEIEKQLQVINKLIVTNYMFELSNGLRIYPIEVEAYFKD